MTMDLGIVGRSFSDNGSLRASPGKKFRDLAEICGIPRFKKSISYRLGARGSTLSLVDLEGTPEKDDSSPGRLFISFCLGSDG